MLISKIRFIAFSFFLLVLSGSAFGATFTVSNTNDTGVGSLRQALADATDGDTIVFDLAGCPCTITLTSGGLVIDDDVTITSPVLSRSL
jgi:hypothetical protein